jgi:hypothetical protein
VSSTIEAGVQSKDLVRHMSIFEIDEALELLMDSAVEEASANNGQLSEELQRALSTYVEAFGEKVDRIAQYLKAQDAEAEIAKREAARLQARQKSAEARAKSLKSFLCYFMESRQLRQLKGRLNTLTRAKNSCDSLVMHEGALVPPAFHRITVSFAWDEWKMVLDALPPSPLAERLADESAVTKEIDRTRLSDALQSGASIQGVELVRGHHIRLS